MLTPASRPRRFLRELKRRRVFRVAAFYVVLAYGVVEVTDLFVPALGLPSWLVTAAALVALAGFPVALVLGWIFDVTPQGVRRTGPPQQEGVPPVAGPGARRLVAGGVGVGILVALAGFGAYGWLTGPGRDGPPAIEAVAVLPFADRSPSGDQDYFSDGLTEELLNALARHGGVRVASRSASFRFRGEAVDVRQVGRQLGVQAVLEGSVQRDGGRLRVTAQLTDAATGFSLWADVYDRELTDVFTVQEDIARRMLAALALDPGPRSVPVVQQGTSSLEAYDHFLRGNHYLARRTADDTRLAIEEYRRAAERDPRFTAALHRKGYAHAIFAEWGWAYPGLTREDVLDRGEAMIGRALEQDSASAEAWLARAYLRVLREPYRLAGAMAAFDRAIALDPGNAEIHFQRGQALMILGRFDQAMDDYHRAVAIEPDRSMALVSMSAIALLHRDHVTAEQWADSAEAVAPGNSYAAAVRVLIALGLGDHDRALRHAELAHRIDRDHHPVPVQSVLAAAHAATGDSSGARDWYGRALQRAGPHAISVVDAYYLSFAALRIGDPDAAVHLLERAEPRGAWLWFLLQMPTHDPLRTDPRFQRIARAADPR